MTRTIFFKLNPFVDNILTFDPVKVPCQGKLRFSSYAFFLNFPMLFLWDENDFFCLVWPKPFGLCLLLVNTFSFDTAVAASYLGEYWFSFSEGCEIELGLI